jgi:hypothetical protein
MHIFALDLGKVSGFAYGEAGSVPVSGAVRLAKPSEGRAVTFGNLVAFLDDKWRKQLPDLVVTEAPPALQGFANMGNAQNTVRATYGYHAIVEAMCARWGLRHEEFHAATVRKFFTGKGNHGSRQATKDATIIRCHLAKLMPADCVSEDQAEAVAVFEYAAHTYANKSIIGSTLFLHGEKPKEVA